MQFQIYTSDNKVGNGEVIEDVEYRNLRDLLESEFGCSFDAETGNADMIHLFESYCQENGLNVVITDLDDGEELVNSQD